MAGGLNSLAKWSFDELSDVPGAGFAGDFVFSAYPDSAMTGSGSARAWRIFLFFKTGNC